jgi:hypothetical protein
MAKPPPQGKLYAFLSALDWNGHIEISDSDRKWLAAQISDFIDPKKDKQRCEVCNTLQAIIVKTTLGDVCKDCIDDFAEDAEEIEEDYGG